jgi:hypothetical protein
VSRRRRHGGQELASVPSASKQITLIEPFGKLNDGEQTTRVLGGTMPTVDTHRLPALPTGDDQDVIRLGGRERIASNVFSAIRSAACTVTTQPGDGLAFLPERTAMVLKEIVKGTACHINATAEDIFDLLAAFQIPVERALPVWPPLGRAIARSAYWRAETRRSHAKLQKRDRMMAPLCLHLMRFLLEFMQSSRLLT